MILLMFLIRKVMKNLKILLNQMKILIKKNKKSLVQLLIFLSRNKEKRLMESMNQIMKNWEP